MTPLFRLMGFCALVMALLAAPAQAAEDDKKGADKAAEDAPGKRADVVTQASITLADGTSLAYTITFGCLPIGEKPDQPQGEICYTAYTLPDAEPASRPVTFNFNGGPGAASVYLHLGVAGPRRMVFPQNGAIPRGVVDLQDNPQTWLRHSDLVFVDPVGTGYSWVLPPPGKKAHEEEGKTSDFWGYQQDLRSLGRFVRVWLTRNKRWSSPRVLAGESYGGLRVAALMQELPSGHDIAIDGAILVSPALDYELLLRQSSHSLLHWMVTLPSMAATARWHGRGGNLAAPGEGGDPQVQIEQFARTRYIAALARGAAMSAEEQDRFYTALSALLGLDKELIARKAGRVEYSIFAKRLLADQGQIVGRYDGTIAGPDPERRVDHYGPGDPSFEFIGGAYAGAMMRYLTEELGVARDERYQVLNYRVNGNWDFRNGFHGQQGFVGTSDEFSLGLTVADNVDVLIAHGWHDLITPYFGSRYLVDQMDLTDAARNRIRFTNYDGGHMFYMRDTSHEAFAKDVDQFYNGLGK